MPKTYIKSSNNGLLTIEDIEELLSLAKSKNFSEYDVLAEDGQFDVGDNGSSEDRMYSIVQMDMFLFNLLLNFSERQKIVFLYLLMREAGYNLTHEECARTLSMKRESYMTVMRSVKKKAGKFLRQQTR